MEYRLVYRGTNLPARWENQINDLAKQGFKVISSTLAGEITDVVLMEKRQSFGNRLREFWAKIDAPRKETTG